MAAALTAAIFVVSAAPRAQVPVPTNDLNITYILPQWADYLTASASDVAQQRDILRARIGEGPRVRVGFTTYVTFDMTRWDIDPDNQVAVRAAMATTIARIDAAVAKANAAGIPLCISFVTAIRNSQDAVEAAAQREDRRNIQWHSDNSMADYWITHSRYARKLRRVREAYVRELGRILAARMALYPDTLVAASGDGEVELSLERSFQVVPGLTPETSLLADYSPFTVAEFRDWLRAAGLYAPGAVFGAEAYSLSARYAGDASPSDASGDGHTLNADFGTSFSAWELKHVDWSLADDSLNDPRAIPASQYGAGGWNPLPAGNPSGFDAPRTLNTASAWWRAWDEFRQTMIWRHNRDFARWVTTSADPASGYTVPSSRWFSDQIPADYLFGFTPQNPDFRLHSSASPFWTADVSPYGSLGITSFNVNLGGGVFARTLAGVAPRIAERRVRWGIFEWNPSVPPTSDPTVYELEMALIEQYRPSLIVPFYWNDPAYGILDTPFETALRGLVDRIKRTPLTLSATTVHASTTSDGSARTGPQVVRVSGAPGENPPWVATPVEPWLEVTPVGDRSFAVGIKAQPYPLGTTTGTVVVSSTNPAYSSVMLTVSVTGFAPGASAAPSGAIDTPVDLAVVSGEVGVTGWAVDDFGVSAVDIYRSPMAGEPVQSNGLVFLGAATLVEGARSDVAGAFPTRPLSTKAGWGFMLLTNMLPNQGNGLFTIWVVARDYDGRSTTLGSRRIDARNSVATLPFGTIDTPGQGETVSGTVLNFGWALTPAPNTIPFDGSTIDVYVDNVLRGHPTYNQFRADIAALFPGYANTNGAIGYYVLDTTTLSNGVHTIAWVVRDDAGNAQGIGSRYFTVANP
ncbi:MAG: hypothetical protein LC753_13865 [Acidobacteria bacterium]|nr:hypothetical protein [Acidobacteriota bacterium]